MSLGNMVIVFAAGACPTILSPLSWRVCVNDPEVCRAAAEPLCLERSTSRAYLKSICAPTRTTIHNAFSQAWVGGVTKRRTPAEHLQVGCRTGCWDAWRLDTKLGPLPALCAAMHLATAADILPER